MAGCMEHTLTRTLCEDQSTRIECSCGYLLCRGSLDFTENEVLLCLVYWNHRNHIISVLNQMWQGDVGRNSTLFIANRKAGS